MYWAESKSPGVLSPKWANLGFTVCGLLLLAGCMYAIRFCASGVDISGHTLGSDDAYISYRYAHNLVNGHGLVYNPGERVEGYTNLLYVLLMTVPFLAGWNVLSFSVAANTLFALLGLTIFLAHARRTMGNSHAVLGGLMVALSPSIWIWVSSGLETPLVFLLQVAIWAAVEQIDDAPSTRTTVWLCISSVLLVLVRADGFVMPSIAIAYLLLKGRRSAAAAGAITLAIAMAGVFSWRWTYYHDIWPNTYYAKVSATVWVRLRASLHELVGVSAREGLVTYFVAIAICAGVFVRLIITDARAVWRLVRFDLFFSVAWIGYWLYVGGDIFEDRFLIVLIPIGVALLFRSIIANSAPIMKMFVCALAILVQLSVPVRSEQFEYSTQAKYDRWVLLGRFLGVNRRGQVLAIDAAGKVPFFSDLKTVDMLGLTDRHIGRMEAQNYKVGAAWVGHNKHDVDYVLARHPDLISTWVDDRLNLSFGLEKEKYESAGYRLRYVVNTRPQSHAGNDILDVRWLSDDQIVSLVRDQYNYAVLERAPGQTP